jgi:hypothetical protein
MESEESYIKTEKLPEVTAMLCRAGGARKELLMKMARYMVTTLPDRIK